ncbi:ATP-binding protein [Streptomyces anulatus]|uniref:ATP-binding protein n=1 Tax=Streptomyces anulatus TaxID=1892 RepID=UPI001C252657|nr:ATP-binding protein [Streptomyces anulatus]
MQVYAVYAALGLAVLAAVVFGIRARRARAQVVRLQADIQAERQRMKADAEALRAEVQQDKAHAAQLVQHSRAVVAEVRHLASVRLPAVVEGLRRPGVSVPGMADERLLTDPVGSACEQVLAVVNDAVLDDRIRTDESAQEIVRSAMGAVRTRSAEAVALVEKVQHRITDPEALREVYNLDHALVLLNREAQRTAVACGDVPGTAREDTELTLALGTAQSRITQHQRVSVANHVPREADGQVLGVQAPAAEPVIMVLAELMENAVYCSVGSGLVRAEVHRTATGVLITVSDSGPGLDTKEKQQFVLRTLESSRLLLRDLGSPPRKGMAAIARLVGRLDGLTLALAPSSARGLRVDLHIDNSLLVLVPERERPTMSGAPLQPIRQREELPAVPAGQQTFTPSHDGPGEHANTALPVRDTTSGFPTRRRKTPDAPAPQREPLPARDAEQVGASYAALQSGTQRGRAQLDDSHGPARTAHTTSWES